MKIVISHTTSMCVCLCTCIYACTACMCPFYYVHIIYVTLNVGGSKRFFMLQNVMLYSWPLFWNAVRVISILSSVTFGCCTAKCPDNSLRDSKHCHFSFISITDSPILYIYHVTTFDYGFKLLMFMIKLPLNNLRQLVALIVSLAIYNHASCYSS